MENTKTSYQPPVVRMIETSAAVICSSSIFTTEDSNYINGSWED